MKKNLFFFFLFLTSFNNSAQQIFKESFSYTDNALLTANRWVAHSGAGTNAIKISTGLSYTGIISAGGSATLTTSGEDISRQSTNQFSTGSIYTSFLMNVSAAQDGGDYFFHLGPADLGTTFRGKVFVKKSGTGFQVGVTKASNTPNYAPTIYEFNKTYLVVMKYTFKTANTTDDEVVLFVNPSLETEPATPTSTTPTGETDAENIGSVALRQGSAANAPTLRIDEINMGLTWKDVISNGSTPSASFSISTNKISNIISYFDTFLEKKTIKYTVKLSKKSIIKITISPEFYIAYPSNATSIINEFILPIASDQLTEIELPVGIKGNKAEVYSNPPKTGFLVVPLETGDFVGKITHTVEGEPTQTIDLSGSVRYNVNFIGFSNNNKSTISPIKTAKSYPDSSVVRVKGVLTAKNLGGFNYIQDATQGIAIATSIGANNKIGDSLVVTGGIVKQTGQVRLITDTKTESTILASKTEAKKISVAQMADNEGVLATIEDGQFTDKKFVFLPSTNYFLNIGSAQAEIRIWDNNAVGMLKPQANSSVTGIVGKFNDKFQLYPRSKDDISGITAYQKSNTNIALDKTLDVAAWNVEWFGNKSNGPSDEALQQTNVKRVLDSLKADVYILSEISNSTAFTDLVSKMSGFKGVCSSAVSAGATADDAQRVCVIYKESVISAVSTKPLLKGTTTITNYPDSFDRFWASGRLPFLFACDATVDGVKRRLNIIGIHARANTASDIPNAERIYQQRKIDVEVLKDSLDKQYKDEAILLAGDFNDDVDETVVSGLSSKESTYKKYVDDTENWQILTKTLSENGFRSYISQDNVIDHLVISNELKTSYLQNSVGVELPLAYINNYRNSTSDHIPVVARFQLQALPLAREDKNIKLGNLYPNPTDGKFELALNENLRNKNFDFNLTNQAGQIYFSKNGKWDDLKEEINEILQKKTAGIYFLKVSDDNSKEVFKISIIE